MWIGCIDIAEILLYLNSIGLNILVNSDLGYHELSRLKNSP